MAAENRKIKLKDGWVQYELTLKNIKNLNLHFTRQGILKVSAPKGVSLPRIEAFIRTNGEFIFWAKKRLEEKIVLDDQWLKRGFIYWRGEKLPLIVWEAEDNQIFFQDKALIFAAKEKETAKQNKILYSWLTKEAQKAAEESFERIYPHFAPYGVARPQIKLRKMTARWGSCSKTKGIILINKRLIHLPPECLDSVMTHELVHLLVANHSAEFYRYLRLFRPNYKREDQLLKQYICQ